MRWGIIPHHRPFCLEYCGELSNFTQMVGLAELSGLLETWDLILSYTPCSLVFSSLVGDNNTGTHIEDCLVLCFELS